MLAFSKLGYMGRLGNQLFQYAFLRQTAEALDTPFYCPEWIGDKIFQLNDEEHRVKTGRELPHLYQASALGYAEDFHLIIDETEISGYFQSARNFSDPSKVRSWYRWKPELVAPLAERYRHIDFPSASGVHLRFGDFFQLRHIRDFYLPSSRYYRRAIEFSKAQKIVVFSDEPKKARIWLKPLTKDANFDLVFLEGNEDWEDLYLMSQCRNMICSASTFSWWGAWLGRKSEATTVAPMEGLFRSSSKVENDDFWPADWQLFEAEDYTFRDLVLTIGFVLEPLVQKFLRKFALSAEVAG